MLHHPEQLYIESPTARSDAGTLHANSNNCYSFVNPKARDHFRFFHCMYPQTPHYCVTYSTLNHTGPDFESDRPLPDDIASGVNSSFDLTIRVKGGYNISLRRCLGVARSRHVGKAASILSLYSTAIRPSCIRIGIASVHFSNVSNLDCRSC